MRWLRRFVGITNDFDNDTRNPCTPDIGADEVTNFTGTFPAVVSITKTADAASVSFGSQVGFKVKLTNNAAVPAMGLTFMDNLPAAPGVNWSLDVGTSDPGWSVSGSPPSQTLVYAPTTLAGSSMSMAHVISSTDATTCGSTLNNTASFTISNGCPAASSGMASASVSVVGIPIGAFSENFDGVTVPALPAGWTATNASGPAPLWVTSNSGTPTPVADSLPNAAFVDDPAVVSDKRLESIPIAIATSAAQLTFRNNYALESGFDGGVLEISIGGGAFNDIVAAGGSFVTGGYTGTISTSFSSPIAGRMAWTGTSSAFITTTANLPAAAAGQNIVLRWRMGSDTSASVSGWRIDSVTISEPGSCPTPMVVSAVSAKTHGGGTGTFNVDLPLSGGPGIECRTGGGTNDYTMVVTFNGPVTVSGSPQAELTAGTGCVGTGGSCDSNGTVSISGNTVTIPLTNIDNAQVINVRLNGVNTAADVPSVAVMVPPMGVLLGDANGDGFVNVGDTALTKSRSGQTTDGTNFRSDVNLDGIINAGDTAFVKAHSGTALP